MQREKTHPLTHSKKMGKMTVKTETVEVAQFGERLALIKIFILSFITC